MNAIVASAGRERPISLGRVRTLFTSVKRGLFDQVTEVTQAASRQRCRAASPVVPRGTSIVDSPASASPWMTTP